ncbi:hypothetical protein DY000_02016950 [Brassica cretica]|uniref:Uncharacterized protein n=1 Tax=Brassica cretica TaxID=69181 RepID=A0ABQ7D7U6_BRACR|nr:hypothetical protein DY000_02016950 [Brassica cretica]
MVSQIVSLGVKDVFTQIAKDVVGQGLEHGTLTFKPKRFDTEPVQSQLLDDCLLGCDRGKRNAEASESCLELLMECYRSLFHYDLVAERFSLVFERILMTHSFLERICQPEVGLANDREESVPFNVLDATFILEFSSSQMFSMLFRDSLGSTETERNALMLEDFS